jgi:hypothetical protein
MTIPVFRYEGYGLEESTGVVKHGTWTLVATLWPLRWSWRLE